MYGHGEQDIKSRENQFVFYTSFFEKKEAPVMQFISI